MKQEEIWLLCGTKFEQIKSLSVDRRVIVTWTCEKHDLSKENEENFTEVGDKSTK